MLSSAAAFAPGEVIFFGEHSVVYGKTAVAAAISRGVEVRAVPIEGQVMVQSHLGRLQAELSGYRLSRIKVSDPLQPFVSLFKRLFSRYKKGVGLKISIHSTIPEASGLASSAAVSAALISVVSTFLEKKIQIKRLVDWVYESEIEIQKRGSILGSACTVRGGFVCVKNGKWNRLKINSNDLNTLIIDTQERCTTSETTARVKRLLEQDPKGTSRLFEEMDEIAEKGKGCLEQNKWADAGVLMSRNQVYLKKLNVSTGKIDLLIQKISDWTWGAKITGAGGGGCVLCLPRDGAEQKIHEIAQSLKCLVLEARIQSEGVRSVTEESLCRQ